jgi:hypothetical protein
MATHLPTQYLSTIPEIVPAKKRRPRNRSSGALRAEGVHPPCDLLGTDTGTATVSVNPNVWAAEQAGSFSEQAPDQWRALLPI